MKYFVLAIAVIFGCSSVESEQEPQAFPEGVYASMLYAYETSGEYENYFGAQANIKLAIVIRDGEWSFCHWTRCYDVIEHDNSISGIWTETSTYDNNGSQCKYTATEEYTVYPDDGDRVHGINVFVWNDTCFGVSTIEAYMLGVNIEALIR